MRGLTTGSQSQSDNAGWQNENVNKDEATQHSKHEDPIRVSAQFRAVPHVLKN
ncbi:MAG: hypothetical protein JWM16_4537 [Verrucomicrobiales bacterium]|nr:hypothetical protein [Verrucomicrobiales bacterium]